MDAFDYRETKLPKKDNKKDLIWNILTSLALLASVCVTGAFLVIFTNPHASINPFPPPTLVTPVAFPTHTPTPLIQLPATWTPAPTQEPTETPTLAPSSTPIPTETPFDVSVGAQTPTTTLTTTPKATGTYAPYNFVVQQGNPIAISSLAFRPEYGCDWMGVGGQVFDLRGSQVSDMFVYLGGNLAGTFFAEQPTITGLLPQYGRGYYEFKLADKPVLSKDTLWVQLRDQAGLSMSDKYYFSTYDNCDKNLIIINFKQVK